MHYDRAYFEGGSPLGGYVGEGYRDFQCNFTAAADVLALKPQNVLELGCARGYIGKKIEDAGVPYIGLDGAVYCWYTRACNGVKITDVLTKHWMPNSHDLCISKDFLEHVAESELTPLLAALAQRTARGLHWITTKDDGADKTHCTLRPLEWWRARLPTRHEARDASDLEPGKRRPPLPEGDGKVKLNVGSFICMNYFGWLNLDVLPLQEFAEWNHFRFSRMDAREGLAVPDGSVDLIAFSHALEHFTYAEGAAILKDFRRALKPGGVLRVTVPDAAKLLAAYHKGTLTEFDCMNPNCEAASTSAGKLNALLWDGHKSLYDAATLTDALCRAGFPNPVVTPFRGSTSQQMNVENIDFYPELSLYMDATC